MTDTQELRADGFPFPEHGCTCFHCGETFTTPGAARDHFGFDPSSDPACRIKLGGERGLVMALRKAEDEIRDLQDAIHQENTESHRAYYSQQVRHRLQLEAVDDAAYERGLADGRKEALNTRASDGVGEIDRHDWPEGVTGAVLNFDDGLLTIRPDGSGQFVFGEDVLDWEQEETRAFRTTKIAASEVAAIFEHIAKWTTLTTSDNALREALESAWLIELGSTEPCNPSYWGGVHGWTRDHLKAVRYSREVDAQSAAESIGEAAFHDSYRICEHSWEANPRKALAGDAS